MNVFIAGNNGFEDPNIFIEELAQRSQSAIVSFDKIDIKKTIGTTLNEIKKDGLKLLPDLFKEIIKIKPIKEKLRYFHFNGEDSVLKAIGFGYLELLFRNRNTNLLAFKNQYILM